jgi:transposase InsO family protein
MDFVSDSLIDGRKFRTFTLVDDCTRECMAIEVDTGLSGARVVRVLERLAQTRGMPKQLVMDNGPQFTSKAIARLLRTNRSRPAIHRARKAHTERLLRKLATSRFCQCACACCVLHAQPTILESIADTWLFCFPFPTAV